MELLTKIYNREKLDKNEIKAVKKYFAALDFVLIEDDYRTMPNKILTSYGILNLVNEFEEEVERFSELTGTVAVSRPDFYNFQFYLSKNSYTVYKNVIVAYLLTHKRVLLEYLNLKYKLALTEKDISRKHILRTAKTKVSNKKVKTLRNFSRKKDEKYIKTGRTTLLLDRYTIYKLVGGKVNDNSRNVSSRELRRNAKFYKNERSIRVTATC